MVNASPGKIFTLRTNKVAVWWLTSMADSLETRFNEEMVNIYRNGLTQAQYNATKFLEMVTMQGGLRLGSTELYCEPSVLAQSMNFCTTDLPSCTPDALSIW